MNSRILVAGLLIAGGVGAVWIYSNRSPEDARPTAADVGKASPDAAAADPADAKLQTPADAPAADPTRTEVAGEPVAEEPSLEPVEPLLELTAIVQASSQQGEDSSDASIDELLNGKHAGKTKAQLMLSLRSVDALLAQQANPDALPKDQVLPPEAIQALGIERTWLKARIGG